MGSFTNNKRSVRVGILLIVALVAAGLTWCSQSEAQENGFSIGFGAVTIGSDVCDFLSMKLGQDVGKWRAAVVTHGAGECRSEPVDAQVGISISRPVKLRNWDIGFGAALFEHGDIAVGPHAVLRATPPPRRTDVLQFQATIVVRRRIGSRLLFDVDHFSAGGATFFNPGRNIYTLGARF